MDSIFWAPQVKKNLKEEDLFPAREELLRMINEYRLQGKDFIENHEIYQAPLNLMPHATNNSSFFHFSFYHRKNAPFKIAFVFIAPLFFLFFSIPTFLFVNQAVTMKDRLIRDGKEAAVYLENGAKFLAARDYLAAENNFDSAYFKLNKAYQQFNAFGAGIISLVGDIPISNPVRSAENMIEAARRLALSGQKMTQIYKNFSGLRLNDIFSQEGNSLDSVNISSLFADIVSAAIDIEKATIALDRVSLSDVPASLREKFVYLREKIGETSIYLDDLLNNQKLIFSLLGANGPRRYLLVFQNSSELRATGGFIGNVALLKITDGIIEKFKFYDVYDLDGQLTEHVIPPQPIQDISSAWSLHDANWFFDFPSSASKISSFYEKEGGATLDGVIAINSSVAEDLLSILGPVQLQGYPEIISSENLVDKLNEFGEKTADIDGFSQRLALENIFNALLSRFYNISHWEALALFNALSSASARKDIQVFLNDESEESFISSLGLSGEQNIGHKNSLAIVHSNINGFKTDRVIGEYVNLAVKVNADASVENTLTIKRKHSGLKTNYSFYRKVNKDYIRVYVPQGSVLLQASGLDVHEYRRPLDYDRMKFVNDGDVENINNTRIYDAKNKVDIFNEYGRTVFGGWAFVSPQEELTLIFRYLTPAESILANTKEWNLTFEKQSGIVQDINLSINFPATWRIKWNIPQNIAGKDNQFIYQGKLTNNIIFNAQTSF